MRHLTTSSTALTTRHTNKTRGRRVTTFTAPAPKTDPARGLVAAIYAWGRIATPVTDPDPCPVAWCVDCISHKTASTVLVEDGAIHASAPAFIGTASFNGIVSALPYEVEERQLKVFVERFDGPDGGVLDATSVGFQFGRRRHASISAAKAREIAAALDKARVSALELAARTSAFDGATGAVSVVRADRSVMHIGAILTADGPYVFINSDDAPDAGWVRRIARREVNAFRPDSWDMTPAAANQLSATLHAAAVLVTADRAALAVTR